MPFQPRQSPFLSVPASCRTGYKQFCPGFIKKNDCPRLELAGILCLGIMLKESYCELQPKLQTSDKLKLLCRPSGKSCHKNTSRRRWETSRSAWVPTWLWLPMVVTSSSCSNSVRLQVSSSEPVRTLPCLSPLGRFRGEVVYRRT